MMQILIVADNHSWVPSLAGFLKSRDYAVDFAPDASAGLALAAQRRYEALIADWLMPGMNCVQFCEALRSERRVDHPLIVIGAGNGLQDKLAAFEAGSDDYLAPPFDNLELAARLDALLRRSKSGGRTRNILQIADLKHNIDTCETHRADRPIKLGPICRKLLELLLREAPRVVTRERLEFEIWGDAVPDRDLLRSHMSMLRKAVDHAQSVKLIHTVHGTGFRIVA
jgi:DNA-binding response OmpR family regulator